MIISFEAKAFEDFNQWVQADKKIYKRIVSLIKDISRSPFEGLGKPEALKHLSYKVIGQDALMMSTAWYTKFKVTG